MDKLYTRARLGQKMINVTGLTKQLVVEKMAKKDQEAAPDVIRQEKLITPSKPSMQPLAIGSADNPYVNKNPHFGAPNTE